MGLGVFCFSHEAGNWSSGLSPLILRGGSRPRAGFTFPTRDQLFLPRRSALGLTLALSSEGRLWSRRGPCGQRSLGDPAGRCPLLSVCLSTLGRHEPEEKTGSHLNSVKTNNRTQRCVARFLVAFFR